APERQQLIEGAPVGRRRSAIKQTSIRVDERPGADAGHQRPTLLERTQARADLLIAELRARAAPPRIDEDVNVAKLVPARVGDDTHTLGAADRFGALADEHHLDLVGVEETPGGQHFPRPGEVELLRSLEDRD